MRTAPAVKNKSFQSCRYAYHTMKRVSCCYTRSYKYLYSWGCFAGWLLLSAARNLGSLLCRRHLCVFSVSVGVVNDNPVKATLSIVPLWRMSGNGKPQDRIKRNDTDATGLQSFGQSPSVANFSELQADDELLFKLNKLMRLKSAEMVPDVPASPSEQAKLPGLVLATLPLVTQGAAAMVDDSFTRCFKPQKRVAWNWNLYLFPAWCMGVTLRYGFLFPLRLLCLALGFLLVGLCFPVVKLCGAIIDVRKWEVL
jgi:hypothetical protein